MSDYINGHNLIIRVLNPNGTHNDIDVIRINLYMNWQTEENNIIIQRYDKDKKGLVKCRDSEPIILHETYRLHSFEKDRINVVRI